MLLLSYEIFSCSLNLLIDTAITLLRWLDYSQSSCGQRVRVPLKRLSQNGLTWKKVPTHKLFNHSIDTNSISV